MSKRNDWLTIMTIVLMMVTSVTGILSWNLSCSYEITNLYGQTVKMYGYGLYSYDTYFQAPISIGTDICILFLVVPIYVYTYIKGTLSSSFEIILLLFRNKDSDKLVFLYRQE